MNTKISSISWIWDCYGLKFTEVRKALNESKSTEIIPTQIKPPYYGFKKI